MRMRETITLLAVAALLGLVPASQAQTRFTITDGQEAASLEADGWEAVSEGVWQRTSKDGRKETFASGAAGLESLLPALRQQVADARKAVAAHPSPANRHALDASAKLVAAVEANLLSAALAGSSFEAATAAPPCTRTFSYNADVNHPGRCINQAYANASYSTSNAVACPEQCTVQTYAYASAQCGSDPPYVESDNCAQTGTNVSCGSFAWSQWGTSCYQYASASIHCPQLNNLYLSQTDSDSICLCSC